MTKAKLDLIANPDLLDMIERSKRGGLCYVSSKRYVKANDHYLPDYDDSQDENCFQKMKTRITCMHGPWRRLCHTKDLRFATTSSLRKSLGTPDNGPVGYLIEVDLPFPKRDTRQVSRVPASTTEYSTGHRMVQWIPTGVSREAWYCEEQCLSRSTEPHTASVQAY